MKSTNRILLELYILPKLTTPTEHWHCHSFMTLVVFSRWFITWGNNYCFYPLKYKTNFASCPRIYRANFFFCQIAAVFFDNAHKLIRKCWVLHRHALLYGNPALQLGTKSITARAVCCMICLRFQTCKPNQLCDSQLWGRYQLWTDFGGLVTTISNIMQMTNFAALVTRTWSLTKVFQKHLILSKP